MTHMWRRCRFLSNLEPKSFSNKAPSTVDPQEIDNFTKFSTDWWDEAGNSKCLHAFNKLRLPFIRDGLINQGMVSKQHVNTPTPLKGLHVLDVGCGAGILSEALARIGAQVTGLDPNPKLLGLAKQHAQNGNLSINYLFSSIEDHARDNSEKYDAIVASEVIEHVTEKEMFIQACVDCLKPSGSFFITTINKTILAQFLGIYFAENILKLLPRGTHQIEKCIEPHKLQRMLEDCHLKTKLIHGTYYNFITNEWHWASNKSITYCLHALKSKEKA